MRLSDGGRNRSGDLFQCGPALTEKRSESKKKERSFPEPCSKEFNRSNEKQVCASSSGYCGDLDVFRLSPNWQRRHPVECGGARVYPAGPAPATTTGPTGTKVGTINIQEAIFGSNEGQKEIQVLQKKFEPKQTELKTQNDDLEVS